MKIDVTDQLIKIHIENLEERFPSPESVLSMITDQRQIIIDYVDVGLVNVGFNSFDSYKKAYNESTSSKHFMEEALTEAYKGIARKDGGPFGSVIVLDGEIIGRGHNLVLLNNDPTAHGEVSAIRDACKHMNSPHLDGAVLYTTSYPCPMCLAAMMWAHIDQFYYGCTVEDAKQIGFDDTEFYHRFLSNDSQDNISDGQIKHKNIMRSECVQLFNYYETLNPTKY